VDCQRLGETRENEQPKGNALFLAADILLTPEFIARVLGEFEHNNFIWQPVSLPRQTKIFWMGSFDCVKACISESLNRFPHTLAVLHPFEAHHPRKMRSSMNRLHVVRTLTMLAMQNDRECSEFYPAPAFQSLCGE